MIYAAIALFVVACLARVGIEHWHRSKWFDNKVNELESSAKRRLDAIDAEPFPAREPHAIVDSLNHSRR